VVLQNIIPSYLYSQYQDDEDLQGFVNAYNAMAQTYLNTLNTLNLPIYPDFVSSLLDWVCNGIYGYPRPTLPSGTGTTSGAINTFAFNTTPFNQIKRTGPTNLFVTNDDVYIRCLNWHFYKGDGKQFTIEWLKRRVARFLFGPGVPASGQEFSNWSYDVGNNYQISVTFGTNNEVTINIVNGIRYNIKGAVLGTFAFNKNPFNSITSSFIPYSTPPLAPIFAAAVQAGVLELPFQYTWVVSYASVTPTNPFTTQFQAWVTSLPSLPPSVGWWSNSGAPTLVGSSTLFSDPFSTFFATWLLAQSTVPPTGGGWWSNGGTPNLSGAPTSFPDAFSSFLAQWLATLPTLPPSGVALWNSAGTPVLT